VLVTEEDANDTCWQKDVLFTPKKNKKKLLVSWLDEGKLCLDENKGFRIRHCPSANNDENSSSMQA
jgi:hypothetical protein